MKIEKRYVVGGLIAIPMLPLIILGFIAYWLFLYVRSGFQIGELSYEWLEETLK